MSHEDDRCFQFQESSHIACHGPNICCFECHEYSHIVMDCHDWIPPSGTPAHHHKKKSNTRHCTRSPSRHHHQDRYRHSRSRSQSPPHDIKVIVTITHTGVVPDLIIDTNIGVLHDAITPACNIIAVTLHHRSSSHRSTLAPSQDHSQSRS